MSEVSVTLGQRLKSERERKGLSAQKVADELHLDGWVIDGLESGDYERIGPPVYAKGHLKRYAELLGLAADDVLASFEGKSAAAPVSLASGMRMRTSAAVGREWSVAQIVGWAVVAASVLAGVLWWHPWQPRAALDSAAPVAAAVGAAASAALPLPAGGADAAAGAGLEVAGAVAPEVGGALGAGGTAAPAPVPAVVVGAPADVASAVAGAGHVRLRLLFLADSWVDVHDAAGQRLFAGNGRVNNARSMSGSGPLRVYIKSASSVHLDINNHSVAIGPQFIVDNVAHFAVGADGVLRRDSRLPRGAAAPPTPAAAHPRG